MTKTLILITILVAILYLYWKYYHKELPKKENKTTQTDATSFTDNLGNDYTIERPILSHKEKRKLKRNDKD
jgi:hypothetical protein